MSVKIPGEVFADWNKDIAKTHSLARRNRHHSNMLVCLGVLLVVIGLVTLVIISKESLKPMNLAAKPLISQTDSPETGKQDSLAVTQIKRTIEIPKNIGDHISIYLALAPIILSEIIALLVFLGSRSAAAKADLYEAEFIRLMNLKIAIIMTYDLSNTPIQENTVLQKMQISNIKPSLHSKTKDRLIHALIAKFSG